MLGDRTRSPNAALMRRQSLEALYQSQKVLIDEIIEVIDKQSRKGDFCVTFTLDDGPAVSQICTCLLFYGFSAEYKKSTKKLEVSWK